MSDIKRSVLFGKLNPIAYRAIDGAVRLCKLRGNPYVELVHWVDQIMQAPDSDLHRIIRRFEIDQSRLVKDITFALDRLPRGATSISDLSTHIWETVERGWVFATLMFGSPSIRTGHLLIAMLKEAPLHNVLTAMSVQFDRIKVEALTDDFLRIVAGSPEDSMTANDGSALPTAAGEGGAPGEMPVPGEGRKEALKRFATDITERARKGQIDPVSGRDEEIRQIVDILMRRRQNNPILTGEAGVGKTAVVEGFALRLAKGDVPPPLKDVQLFGLDIGALQAGAGVRGEFENRVRSVIEEVQASPKPVILFIDEAHTLIGAGGAQGTGDAANLLKPALARGTLRTIAATTWAEYKRYIEKDPALTRRFQVIQVSEPSEERAILMVRGVASVLEKHHRVQVLDEALEAAVRLSHRYIPARQLPDKAISLLDTACARVAISQSGVPAELEDCRRQIESLQIELDIIGREEAIGIDVAERKGAAAEKLAAAEKRRGELEQRWTSEKEIVENLLKIRAALRKGSERVEGTGSALERAAQAQKETAVVAQKEAAAVAPKDASTPSQPAELSPEERATLLAELRRLQSSLTELQGEAPLILPSVDEQAVASVVQDWTGVPVGRMVRNEIEAVLKLADTLNQRVIGQSHALETIARRIQTSRAKLDNPNKPIGVFMLCGPSGVGKTETALAVAEALYGGEQNVITINMSEFQEAHTVSTLKGAPPGYVGYGEGGVLTEAVRRRPYSVVLLDEVEKAHSDVHELFFQVFDKGWMEDGEGRRIDFKNTIILLTSNVGTELIMGMCKDPDLMPEPEGVAKALREPLLKKFPAALLGRLVVVPYYPLGDTILGNIVRLQLGRITKRVAMEHGIPFTYDDEAVKLVVGRCTEVESGGRMIDAILTNTVLPAISREFLSRTMQGAELRSIRLAVENGDFAYHFE